MPKRQGEKNLQKTTKSADAEEPMKKKGKSFQKTTESAGTKTTKRRQPNKPKKMKESANAKNAREQKQYDNIKTANLLILEQDFTAMEERLLYLEFIDLNELNQHGLIIFKKFLQKHREQKHEIDCRKIFNVIKERDTVSLKDVEVVFEDDLASKNATWF